MEQLQTQQPISNDEVQNDEVNKEWDDLPEPPTQEPEQQPEEEEPEEKEPERTLTIINCLKCGHTTKTYENVQACENCGYDAFAHTNEENKAFMDAKKVKKVQDTLHDILLKGIVKKYKDEPKLTVDKHTKISKELVFTDILNTKYEVVEKQAQYLDEHETFADIARRGLDPNVSKNPEVYGVGRRLEPKNVTIARMKADIDLAGAELQKRKQAYAEYVAQLEQQTKQVSEPQPTNEPKGDN